MFSSVISPCPFAKWRIDLIGPLPIAQAQAKFAVMVMDYFTMWVEAEPLSTILRQSAPTSSGGNICLFGVPYSIITDNGKQFNNPVVKEMCQELGIHKLFSTPRHPQANEQVEMVNKTIKDNLKKKLEQLKGAWVNELPMVL